MKYMPPVCIVIYMCIERCINVSSKYSSGVFCIGGCCFSKHAGGIHIRMHSVCILNDLVIMYGSCILFDAFHRPSECRNTSVFYVDTFSVINTR